MRHPQRSTRKARAPVFKVFQRLPVELRLMVWELGIPGPRIIKIVNCNVWRAKFHGGPFPGYLPSKPESYSVPGMMHACSESREVCKKFYEVAFEERLYGRPLFFNFCIDILYFKSPKALFAFYKGWGQDVANDRDCPCDIVEFEKKLKHVILGGDIHWVQALEAVKRLGSLQTLILESGVTFNITRAAVKSLLEDAWKMGKDNSFQGPAVSWKSRQSLNLRFKVEKDGTPIRPKTKTAKAARPKISRRSARIRCQVRKLGRTRGRNY